MLEILVAMVIIALAVGPLLGALIESMTGAAEHRSFATLDTVLRGFAETATSEIQLDHASGTATPSFDNCAGAPSYRLMSLPVPRIAAPGAAVSVFVTGFGSGLALTTFDVTVGGVTARKSRQQSQLTSGRDMGNMQITFFVPAGLTGTQAISVTGTGPTGGPVHVSSTNATELSVSATAVKATRSPVANYVLGVSAVRYWNPKTPSTHVGATACTPNGGMETLTLFGRSTDGVSSDLTFDLRNPTDVAIPVPTPSVTVSATPTPVARPSGTSTARLTFTATVQTAAGTPPPTQPIAWSWTVTGGQRHTTCTTENQTAGSGPNTEVATCAIVLSSASTTGRYAATATYPQTTTNTQGSGTGFAWVYAADGSGSMTVSPASVTAASVGNVITFTYTAGTGGLYDGEVAVTVPTPGSTPKKRWTPPQASNSSGAGYTGATAGGVRQTVVISGWTIQVTGVTLKGTETLSIVYGDGGGASGVTAPTQPTTYAFGVQEQSVPTGGLSTLTPKSVAVKVT